MRALPPSGTSPPQDGNLSMKQPPTNPSGRPSAAARRPLLDATSITRSRAHCSAIISSISHSPVRSALCGGTSARVVAPAPVARRKTSMNDERTASQGRRIAFVCLSYFQLLFFALPRIRRCSRSSSWFSTCSCRKPFCSSRARFDVFDCGFCDPPFLRVRSRDSDRGLSSTEHSIPNHLHSARTMGSVYREYYFFSLAAMLADGALMPCCPVARRAC